jgi:hypothetical protein
MPRHLTNLRIDEVSSVDRGAGKGVRVVLTKNHTPAQIDKALAVAVEAIKADGGGTADIVECFKQFHKFLNGDNQETDEMTPEQIAKLVSETVGPAVAEAVAKLKAEGTFEKMTKEHQDYANNLDGDEAKRFSAMGHGDRTKYVKDNPINSPDNFGGADSAKKPGKTKKPTAGGDSAAGDTGKAKKNDDADDDAEDDITKAMRSENEILKKRIGALEERDLLGQMQKHAVDLGLQSADGDMLLKARRGDVKAIEAIEKKLSAAIKAADTGKLFSEFGHGGGQGAPKTAHDEILAKAQDLRKVDPKLTAAQAYTQVLETDVDLAKRERDERYEQINKVNR